MIVHFVTSRCKIEDDVEIVIFSCPSRGFKCCHSCSQINVFIFTAIIIFVIPCYELTFKREYPACWTYGFGRVHHSLLPRGPGSSLACICPGHARRGGGVRGFQMTGALAEMFKPGVVTQHFGDTCSVLAK